MFDLKVKQKNIQLRLERDQAVPQFVFADAGKLRQVLVNLVANGVKFTNQGRVRLSVQAVAVDRSNIENHNENQENHHNTQTEEDPPSNTACPDTDHHLRLSFSIEDTGIGIAADDFNMLFAPFEQTAAGRANRKGSGLGLSISQQYAQLMGGHISVTSTVGKGSLFMLQIPVQPGTASDWRRQGSQKTETQTLPLQATLGEIAHSSVVSESADRLRQMPAAWIEELRQAAGQLKSKRVLELIHQIPEHETSLRNDLTEISHRYQFGQIIALLDEM